MTYIAVVIFLSGGEPFASYRSPPLPTLTACQAALALERDRMDAIAAQVTEQTGRNVIARMACIRQGVGA